MSIQAGARLGRYEILSRIGAGGMGVVYKATDLKLRRTVAIKVLPEGAAGDASGRRRFEHEARTVAALSHPNLCTLFDFASEEGVDFLVMEYLEGESLAARLGRGPMPVAEAVVVARGIAAALGRAHQAGIVHRDVKPANVMLTPEGPKLLDFGLALLRSRLGGAPPETRAETATARVTAEGKIVGTLNYMAPEQLEGGEVDARSDVFALGATLFEMATGRRAFDGPTTASVAAAILRGDPFEPDPGLPSDLQRLLASCLAKRADARWSSARDVLLALESLTLGEGESAPATGPPARSTSWLAWSVAIAAILAAAGVVVSSGRRGVVGRPVYRAMVVPPIAVAVAAEAPVVSPDGGRLAFVGTDASGTSRIYLQPLDSLSAEPVAGTVGSMQPFWSPDGQRIGFFAEGKLKTVSATGGEVRVLADAPVSRGGSWGSDGTILFTPSPRLGVWAVPAAGGEARPVTGVEAPMRPHWFPAWLPGGRDFVYLHYVPQDRTQSRLVVASLDGEEVLDLMPASSSVLFVGGYLWMRQEARLVALPFDAERLEITGEAVTLAASVATNAVTSQLLASASQNGVLAYLDARGRSRLVWMDRSGKVVEEPVPTGDYGNVCLTADGDRAIFDRADTATGNLDLWALESDRAPRRLTFDPGIDFYPACSADGPTAAFASLRKGAPEIYVIDTAVPGSERLVLAPGPKAASDLSRDGRLLVYAALDDRSQWDLGVLTLDAGDEPVPFLATEAIENGGRLSPDGRWMAYHSNAGGTFEVYVRPFPSGPGTWQVSTAGGFQPRWRGDGRELYYISQDRQLMAVAVGPSAASFEAGDSAPLFGVRVASWETLANGSQYAVTPDAQRFLVNLEGDGAGSLPISVVVGWQSLLDRP